MSHTGSLSQTVIPGEVGKIHLGNFSSSMVQAFQGSLKADCPSIVQMNIKAACDFCWRKYEDVSIKEIAL